MSAPPVILRRSTRNAGKRESPTTATEAVIAPPAKKAKRAPAEKKEKAAAAVPKAAAVIKKAAAAPKEKKEKPVAFEGLKDGDALPTDLPEIKTHADETTTLSALVDASKNGIVIFAYPKASTPGCTTQACAFRDSTASFSAAGYNIFGISGDLPAANEKFATKHNLADIVLLCDPSYELHERFGIKKGAKGTVRSVIVIKKGEEGKNAVILKKSIASPANSVSIAEKAIGIEKKPADEEKTD